MTCYVAGLLFSEDETTVALVRKKRGPSQQVGKLNAIGGHIEAGEEPFFAMCREFREETGVDVSSWSPVAVLTRGEHEVHFFAAFSDDVYLTETMEDEEIVRAGRDWAMLSPDSAPDLRVIIPLALDTTGIVKPVQLTDRKPVAA